MTMVRTLATLTTVAALSACSLTGGEDPGTDPTTDGSAAESGPITLVTHGSFELPKQLRRRFEQETGRTLRIRAAGDAGTLTTKLALAAGNPEGDVAFGVDNTFASRALGEDVFEPVEVERPSGVERYDLPEGSDRMVPIDTGNVCVNVDTAWFEQRDQDPPESFDDLIDPAYEDLTVIPGAATSSPGMAFLLATIDEYGDGWTDYWTDLMDNGAALEKGWTEAYYTGFSASGGDRPIVVSYDSSPAFTLSKDQESSTTSALLDTCFRQVEYAGVLAGADDPEGARQLVEFMLTPEFQAALPEAMYVFPVRDDVELPTDWAAFAQQPEDPAVMDPAEIAERREQWLTEWTDITTR